MHYLSAPLCAALAAVLLPGLSAQDTRVAPAGNTSEEGTTRSPYPFGYVHNRTQQVWASKAVTKSTALLYGISYRIDGRNRASVPGRTYTNATVSLGKTSVAPNSMSPTFAKNITQPMTTVLNAAKLVLPAQPAPTTSPMAFNVNLSWTRPFIFLAGKDNLLLDMSLAGSQAKSSYFVDAEYTDTTSAGRVGYFGSNGSFSSPEMFTMAANAPTLKPGGLFDVACGSFRKAYTGTLIIGLSNKSWSGTNLPLDLSFLGAPKNNLYTSMDVLLPFNTVQGGLSHRSSFKAPIPNLPIYGNITVHAQALYADAKANAAGLVTTGALTLTTANVAGSAPVTHLIGNPNYLSPTGSSPNNNRFSGPVVRFTGILP